MADKALTSKNNGALWVQIDGPNTKPEFLGCHDLGDIVEPSGSIELIRCIQPNGLWKTVGATQAPPDPVTTSIDSLTFAVRDWLEKIECDFTLFAMFRVGGSADIFDNYTRAIILNHSRITSRSDKGIKHHEEDQASMQSRDIEAWPPAYRTGALTARRQSTSELMALLDVHSYSQLNCDDGVKPGQKVVASADATAYTGNVQETENGGDDWAAAAADPFATGKAAMAVRVFPISDSVNRILAIKEAESGVTGLAAYSDNRGVSWTQVQIGSASAGHGAVKGGALFVLDQGHIWLASADGYIWFSNDGGATWTDQTSGDLSTEDGLSIAFLDENYGMAGFAADEILVTTNGGETWEIATAVTGSGDNITSVSASGNYFWVGTSGGELFYSRTVGGVLGSSWTQRAFTGSGSGSVPAVAFYDEVIGYMIHNTSGPVGTILVTVNGGYSWRALTTPTNAGLNALSIADRSTVYAVGNAQGGTAVIVKATWD